MPERRGEAGPARELRRGVSLHGAEPPASSATLAAEWGPYINASIEAFGVDRCMVESNYPVDSGAAGYGTIWNAFKRVTTAYSPDERAALFARTAADVYRLELSESASHGTRSA